MAIQREAARYNVISLRISKDELELLKAHADQSKQSISDLMRDALSFFIGNDTEGHGDAFACREETWYRQGRN